MEIAVRHEIPVATLRFSYGLAESAYEACRLQVSVPLLRGMVDVICRTIDYYPQQPQPKT